MKAQMRYADKRGTPNVLTCGENEQVAGQVTIKNLRVGKQAWADIESGDQWTEERTGQETLADAQFVRAVKERF